MPHPKIYTFNGTSFTMLKNSLDLLNNANDMLIKYRKKLFEYTSDLDMSEVNKYRNMIEEHNISIQFIEKRYAEAISANDEQKAAEEKNEMARVRSLLDEMETEFNNNVTLQNLIRLESDCRDFVLLAIITDKKLMKKTLSAILIGDTSKLDFEHPDIFHLIRKVITDFFLFMGKNSLQS